MLETMAKLLMKREVKGNPKNDETARKRAVSSQVNAVIKRH